MKGAKEGYSTSETEHSAVLLTFLLAWLVFSGLASPAAADTTPAPPASFSAQDKPNDSGSRIVLEWEKSPDDKTGKNNVVGYNLYRADAPQGSLFEKLNSGVLPQGNGRFEDVQEYRVGGHRVENGKQYFYRIKAVGDDGTESVHLEASASAATTIYSVPNTNTLITVATYMAILMAMILSARAGRKMFVRRIPGIDAIEEAVGRATEMGKPVLYTCGMHDLAEVNTIAAINILSGVAKKVGEYQSRLILPCRDPMVMTVAQEVVKESYLSIGRPDAYREEDIFYTTYDQFPYVASVDGIMLREKPATNLYMGYYYAESLILAETGAITGAIQIAGTDAITQLPFFVTACDYTIIGEELYAASAYISEDPQLLGSLKGQDFMKLLLGVVLLLGIVAATLHSLVPDWSFLGTFVDIFKPVASG